MKDLLKKKWFIISSGSVLVIAIVVAGLFFFKPTNKLMKKITAKITRPNEPEAYCPIDGMPTTIEVAEQKPLALMVENLSTIRPQSGLSKACIVFEALAEGGITRFLAVFNHNAVKKIGPVRSARPYYVALATGFDAIYGHAGGSTVGLQKIKEYGVDDFDYNHMAAYWRQSGIGAPHNLFTATSRLRSEAAKAGLTEANYTGFSFDEEKLAGKKATGIKVKFSSGAYEAKYIYDAKAKKYKRFNGGLAHTDANTKKQITPSNIVVVRAATSMYDALTLNVAIIGKGEGYFFRNGKAISITWEKKSADSQITFKDKEGEEVKFAPGQIWVEIVRPDTPVEFN